MVWVRDSQLNSVHGRFTVVHYFYSKLEPWTHYVPLIRDLSDVVGKVQWARERDEEVSRLGVGVQWNLSIEDTIRIQLAGLYREVSLI